jgi:hypothetical protein
VPLEFCLSDELDPGATAAVPAAPPATMEGLAPKDEDGFDLPFFCTGRLKAGVN